MMSPSHTSRTRRAVLGAAASTAALAVAACGVGAGQQASTATKQPVKLTFEWPTYTPPKQEWAEYAMRTYS